MTWLRAIAVILAALAAAGPARASIQHQMFCWDSDVEFPIACAEEEDDDDDDGEPGYAPTDWAANAKRPRRAVRLCARDATAVRYLMTTQAPLRQ